MDNKKENKYFTDKNATSSIFPNFLIGNNDNKFGFNQNNENSEIKKDNNSLFNNNENQKNTPFLKLMQSKSLFDTSNQNNKSLNYNTLFGNPKEISNSIFGIQKDKNSYDLFGNSNDFFGGSKGNSNNLFSRFNEKTNNLFGFSGDKMSNNNNVNATNKKNDENKNNPYTNNINKIDNNKTNDINKTQLDIKVIDDNKNKKITSITNNNTENNNISKLNTEEKKNK